MQKYSTNLLLYGHEEPIPEPLQLRAGELTATFEPDTGFLRYIRLGDQEVLRAIYGAVRDQNWNTVPARFLNLTVDSQPEAFDIQFDAECRQPGIEFVWHGRVQGRPGEITFSFDGEARTSFLRNRIGLCVLHPIAESAGRPCVVEHPDGSTEEGTFPKTVSPYQPFKNIRAIRQEVAAGTWAEIRFDGDVFEMEDQRNWTDASFKTYSTPLEIPIPVQVEPGTRIRQSVSLKLIGKGKKILPVVQGRPPQFSIATTPVYPKPPIGLSIASHGRDLSPLEIERLRTLLLSHLRIDLHLGRPGWEETLRQGCDQSTKLAAGLHCALFVTDQAEAELDRLLLASEQLRPTVSLWLIFHESENVTQERWVQLARQKLGVLGRNILFAAGSKGHFVDLNRNRPDPNSPTLPCFSIHPQVHAFDNRTLIENVAAQAQALETLQQFCPRPAVVSPITLGPRPTPAGTTPADPRQWSLFGAGWTLGSIAALATGAPLHSLTYFETTGPFGIMESGTGSPAGQETPAPSPVFPVYHLFADLAGYDRLYATLSSHPLQTLGLTLLNSKNRRRILVANLLDKTQEVKIKTGPCSARVHFLDERNLEEAMHSPESFRNRPGDLQESKAGKIELTLLPCALARIDVLE